MDENFWQTQTHRDARFAEEIKKLSQKFKWCCGAFIILSGFCSFCFAIKPIFNSEQHLPLASWLPQDNTHPYYEIVYLVQIYVLFMATTAVGGFDMYYVAVILRYIVQFKLLRYELERLISNDDEETKRKIKTYVDYHNFLIK